MKLRQLYNLKSEWQNSQMQFSPIDNFDSVDNNDFSPKLSINLFEYKSGLLLHTILKT